ncbi:GerAB/ArcD/ProY family transporter [Ammoniphilus sp. CFH 90114]|uniref:GerAB/ArcD/ProY family transporter n=1 Tax=Ammoniphilus sp. CFH 90114 TaxID=2493665 RepID=UPI00100E5673|nr:GerAB/ArcD/ProY family transporter [Ammoniphilus sp. CFH 90114]RXT13670.1 spore gernimation protein [Ammoniphilus sp. CFH 90114]
MTSLSLFNKNTTFDGIYVVFIINRMQVLYFLLVMPGQLVDPYMIWGILAIGLLSQINLFILSKWFASHFAEKGFQGFVELFGSRIVRFLAVLVLILLLIKISTLLLGVGEVVYQYIFPSMNSNWLILFIFLVCYYVAAQGVENTIRFVMIAFFSTIWMLILFSPFFFPSTASLHNLYPLIPTEWSNHSWKGLLFIWSAFSGPEFLVFLAPWLKPQQRMLKYFSIANAISVLEYLLIFIAALFFFGSAYLNKTKFPAVDMIRYLQSPAFERIDIILIAIHLFILVFVISFYMLFFYYTGRIVLGTRDKQATRFGFTTSWLVMVVTAIVVNEGLWKSGEEQNLFLNLEIWSRAFTYLVVPAFLLGSTKLKERF